MESKVLILLTLIFMAVAFAKAEDRRRRSMFAERRATGENSDAQKQRQMEDISAGFRKAMMSKRGVFDCAGFLEECHVFKHCCGDWECNRDHIFESGVCVINLDK